MTDTSARRWGRLLCLFAGAGDAATGLLLITLPAATFALLGLPVPSDPVLVRLLGVFVGAVGAATVYPLLLAGGAARRDERLATAVEITTGVRLAVAALLGVALLQGALPPAWTTVAATDGLVAAAFLALRARGGFPHAI